VTITGTWTNLGTVTTVDVNGGTLDGVIVGGASAAAGTFTTLNGDTLYIAGDLIVAPTQNYVMTASGVSLSVGGDTTPNGKLHVIGAGGAASGAAYATNPVFVLEDTSAVMQVAVNSGKKFQLNVGNSDSDEGYLSYDTSTDKWKILGGASRSFEFGGASDTSFVDAVTDTLAFHFEWPTGSVGGSAIVKVSYNPNQDSGYYKYRSVHTFLVTHLYGYSGAVALRYIYVDTLGTHQTPGIGTAPAVAVIWGHATSGSSTAADGAADTWSLLLTAGSLITGGNMAATATIQYLNE